MNRSTNPPSLFDQFDQINKMFLRPLTVVETSKLVVKAALKISEATYGSLFFYKNRKFIRVYSTVPKRLQTEPRSKGKMYECYSEKKSFVVPLHQFNKRHPEAATGKILLFADIALHYQHKSVGVLNLSFTKPLTISHQKLLQQLEFLGTISSLAIRKAQLHENLLDAVRNRDMFISIAAHELRTPLTTIRGCAEIIVEKLKQNTLPSLRVADMVLSESKRMSQLVNELLVTEQIQRGKFQYDWQIVDIKELLQGFLQKITMAYPDRLIQFKDLIPESAVRIVGDEGKLIQVFTNTLQNAYKFSDVSKPVTITLAEVDRKIVITFKDQGIGIAKDELPKVFQGFYKSSRHTKEGMGLGLYVSKSIIEKHKGTITIQSQPNKGSQVIIMLPEAYKYG